MSRKITYETLVLSSGGVRGLAMIGALAKLKKRTDWLDNLKEIVGVSVGSIIGTLLAMNISMQELYNCLVELDTSSLRQMSIFHFADQFGFDTGARLVAWIQAYFMENGYSPTVTFIQLFRLTGITLHIGAVNVERGEQYFFSHLTEPDCAIVEAIRMSCGIPYLFTLWKYKGAHYIDGAIIDNFPLSGFCRGKYDDGGNKTLGVILRMPITEGTHALTNLIDYTHRLISLFTESMTTNTVRNKPFECDIINIECAGDFSSLHVSKMVKGMLFEQGQKCADDFITT